MPPRTRFRWRTGSRPSLRRKREDPRSASARGRNLRSARGGAFSADPRRFTRERAVPHRTGWARRHLGCLTTRGGRARTRVAPTGGGFARLVNAQIHAPKSRQSMFAPAAADMLASVVLTPEAVAQGCGGSPPAFCGKICRQLQDRHSWQEYLPSAGFPRGWDRSSRHSSARTVHARSVSDVVRYAPHPRRRDSAVPTPRDPTLREVSP